MAYVRTVKTASGAVAVQIVHSNRRGSREIEHIGSAHTPGEVEVLKTVAQQRLHVDQDTLDFDDGQLGDTEAPIVSSQARHLWETLGTAYRVVRLGKSHQNVLVAWMEGITYSFIEELRRALEGQD